MAGPHDALFKNCLPIKQVAQEIIQAVIEKELIEKINFDTLALEPSISVDEELEERRLDVLFSTEINGQQGYILFLFEHQSSPDKFMPLRQLVYMVRHWESYLKLYPQSEILPVIIPIIFYAGKPSYHYSTDILDLFGDNKSIAQRILFKPFRLVDLSKVSLAELKEFTWYGLLGIAMKYVRDEAALLDALEEFSTKLVLIEQDKGGSRFTYAVIKYLIEVANIQDRDRFKQIVCAHVSSELGEKVMTLAESWKQEGRQEGRQEVARAMLEMGSDESTIIQVTGLSLQELHMLQPENAS